MDQATVEEGQENEQQNNESQDDAANGQKPDISAFAKGFAKASGIEPEADAQPAANVESNQQGNEGATPDEPVPQEPKYVQLTEEDVASLRARADQVPALEAQIKTVYDKAFGKIGELNRTIQQIQQGTTSQPVTDGQSAAAPANKALELKRLKESFPELAGTLADDLADALATARGNNSGQAYSPEEIRVIAKEIADQQIYEDRKEQLTERHSDWKEVRKTPEYAAWLQALPEADRTRFVNSNSPTYVAGKLDEFKTWRAKQAKARQNNSRIDNAVAPTNGRSPGGPSIPDASAAFAKGFNKVRKGP